MKTKEFDAHIRNKFEESDFEYKAGAWERLDWQMENNVAITSPTKNKKRGFLLISGIAASILLAGALIFGLLPTQKNATRSAVSSVSDMAVPQSVIATELPLTETPPAEEISGMENIVRHRPAHHSIIPQNNIGNDIAVARQTEEKTGNAVNQSETKAAINSKDINLMNMPADAQNKKQYTYNEYATYPEEKITHKKIDLSLGGGYNYGSLGSGYAVNANMQKNIGAGFFIAGDVGIVNNTAGNTTITQTSSFAPPPNVISGTPGVGTSNAGPGFTGAGIGNASPSAIINAKSTGTVSTVSVNNINLLYMQVTPMIGYKIGKKITVGAGADIQRLLQDRYDYVTDANGNIFAIPATDIGMTGKAEYTLTPRIKTGVQYRNGISNMLESGKNYLERDYFQVQVKCRISK